jgi:hypothetical protein
MTNEPQRGADGDLGDDRMDAGLGRGVAISIGGGDLRLLSLLNEGTI